MDNKRNHTTATAHRRQRQIEDCLYDNLLRLPYHSISIADLCRQVGISRKAFYNYFRDKDDCFSSFIDRVLHESVLHTTQRTPDNATPLEAAIILLDYWKELKPLFDILIRNNLFHFIIMRNIHYALTEDKTILDLLSTPEVKTDADILACYTSCQLTLTLQWYLRGFDTPTEEMAKKFLRLLHSPMIQSFDVPGNP